MILCLSVSVVLAGCATPPRFAHPTHSGIPVRAGHKVVIVDDGSGKVATGAIVGAAKAAQIFADALKGAAASQ